MGTVVEVTENDSSMEQCLDEAMDVSKKSLLFKGFLFFGSIRLPRSRVRKAHHV